MTTETEQTIPTQCTCSILSYQPVKCVLCKPACEPVVYQPNACPKQSIRVPWYSERHPMIPRLYVQPWTQDMKNRSIIFYNAKKGGVPTYEHDDALYLEKREQLKYNVQDRRQVDARTHLPLREVMMYPEQSNESKKKFSGMLARHPY